MCAAESAGVVRFNRDEGRMNRDAIVDRVTTDIDPFSSSYILDPYPFHQQMRDIAPVVWLEKWSVWAVARYKQVQ